jgi:hypothetical protein
MLHEPSAPLPLTLPTLPPTRTAGISASQYAPEEMAFGGSKASTAAQAPDLGRSAAAAPLGAPGGPSPMPEALARLVGDEAVMLMRGHPVIALESFRRYIGAKAGLPDGLASGVASASDAALHRALVASGDVLCIRKTYLLRTLGNPAMDPLRCAGWGGHFVKGFPLSREARGAGMAGSNALGCGRCRCRGRRATAAGQSATATAAAAEPGGQPCLVPPPPRRRDVLVDLLTDREQLRRAEVMDAARAKGIAVSAALRSARPQPPLELRWARPPAQANMLARCMSRPLPAGH